MKTNRLIALGMALVAISFGLGRYAFGLFVPEIREVLGIGPAAVGGIASAGHLGYIAAIVLCMRLIALVSPRVLMLLGAVSATAGLFVVTVAGSAWMLALGTFLASMSAGWIWTATPDALRQLQPPETHARVISWANAGTGLGVLVAAPLALLVAGWRGAFVAYGLVAVAVTLWGWVSLPRMHPDTQARRIPVRWHWLVCPRSGPLLGMSLAMGLVAALYWTFAVDLIAASGNGAPWIGRLFWFVSGAAGILGVGLAGIIRRYGIRRVIPVNVVGLALALVVLALFPSNLVAVLLSAVSFGLGFITITGLLAIWSVRVFEERPSAGLGAVLILVAAGQVIGPVVAGTLAEQVGLVPVFLGGAVLALGSMVLRPPVHDDLRATNQISAAA